MTDFEKVCRIFTMEEPFYGVILSSMNKRANTRIDTLGVSRDGDSFILIYNPDFLAPLSDRCVHELLKHEMEHICFDHFFMGNETGYRKMNPQLFNIACDLECNSYLDRSNVDESINKNLCWAEDFGFPKELGTIAYWKLLQDKQSQESSQGTSGNGVQGLNSFDDHSIWPDVDENTARRMSNIIEQVIIEAAENAMKGHSYDSLPEGIKIRISKMKKKARPVANWKRYCRRYMGNEYTDYVRKSRRRESKRFPGMMGTAHQRTSKILVAIDTSGSVSMPEYMEFMAQVRTMKGSISFDIVECDTTIRHMYTFKGTINTELHGGGGTNFEEPIKLFYERGTYDALVYFTDGFCPIPDNTPSKTLWVISSKGNKENDYKKNNAKVVFIPPQEEE